MNRSMKDIVHNNLLSHLEYLCYEVQQNTESMVIDGVEVFNSGDRFVAGKIINGGSYVLTMNEPNKRFISCFKQLIQFTAPRYMETWGYLNYIQGLYRLKQNNLLEEVVDKESLEILKKSLDWRHFVNIEDLSLINKPTNYYGVAFSLAKYRELLGWDEGNYSELLFDQLMKHIVEYSGDYSYMDETPGEGRFDRYSILIPGELCSTLHETGMDIPKLLIKMLKQSVKIVINLANKNGNGIAYGRSIGAYGDTAVLEILSIAATLQILDETEMEIAYGYCSSVATKFTEFWIDDETKSINMWDKGRRTDEYRNKGRILGENFSLCCQVIHTYHQWLESDYQPVIEENWLTLLNKLPKHKYFCFSKGEYERGLVVNRDGEHIFMLPLINGGGGTAGAVHGKSYYYATPYLPFPQEDKFLEAQPDSNYPNLVPKISLENGVEVMPVSYTNQVDTFEGKDKYEIITTQSSLCQIGERYPREYREGSANTEYCFAPNTISRKDTFVFKEGQQAKLYMEFYTFSTKGITRDDQTIAFSEGEIKSIEVTGFDKIKITEIEDTFSGNTSHGKLATKIEFTNNSLETVIEVCAGWKITYR